MRALALTVALGGSGCVIQYEVRDAAVAAESSDSGASTNGVGDESGDDSGSGGGASSSTGPPLSCEPDEAVCDAECARLESDPDHCGACGVSCPAEFACDRGECRDGCRDGKEICERYCVDEDTDPLNCGACGEVCDGTPCVDGSCEAPCDPPCDAFVETCDDGACVCRGGLTQCGTSCVDTATDPAHCGDCDAPCVAQACGDGNCVATSCEGFPDICGASCTDVSADRLHCGGCDQPCASSETCTEGACEPEG